MADENPNAHQPSKVHRAISIGIPLLPILLLILFVVFDPEFREYLTETAIDGFYSAKEGLEMLEFMAVVLGGIVIFGIFYAFNVLKIKKIKKEHQETILRLISDEKSLILLGMVMLLLCILVYAPYQEYKNDQALINKLQGLLTNKKSKPTESKPLPEKTIPQIPSAVVVMPVPQVTNSESGIQMEADILIDGDAESELKKAKAEKQARIDAEDKLYQANDQMIWSNNLPLFNSSLQSLHDILEKEAGKQGDGLLKSATYYRCLPPVIDFKMEEKQVAEIRFQNNTNMHFSIIITKSAAIAGPQRMQPNGLKIQSDCGYLEMRPCFSDAKCTHRIYAVPGFGNDDFVPDKNPNKFIADGLKILVGAQFDYLSSTNK